MGISDLISEATPINGQTGSNPSVSSPTNGGISGLLKDATPIQKEPDFTYSGKNVTLGADKPVPLTDTSKMFSSFLPSTTSDTIKSTTPDDSTLGIAENTFNGLPDATGKVGKYIYNQVVKTVAPGITEDEANDPNFLKETVKGAPKEAYNIGKEIITHPIVSTQQAVKGTVLGTLDFLSNAIVNYIPGLVPQNEKATTIAALQDVFKEKLFPGDTQDNLGKGFEAAGQGAIPIAVSGGVGDLAAGAIGGLSEAEIASLPAAEKAAYLQKVATAQFGGGTAGFLATGQTQLPSDATIQERAKSALDALVQQGIFTAGSYGYNIAKGMIVEGLTNSYKSANGLPTSADKGIESLNNEVNNVVNKHGEDVAHVALTEKGIEPNHASKIISEATPPESKMTTLSSAPTENDQTSKVQETTPITSEKPTEIVPASEQRTTEEPVAKESNTPSKIGKSIEAKAIESKLTKGFSTVAGYDPTTFKEQAEKAADVIDTNIDDARAIIRGEKPLPEGLRGTALIAGMEEYIKKNPDPAMAEELANSDLVSGNSAAAQELVLSKMREQDSATAKLQEMRKAKEEAVGGDKVIKATRKSVNTEVNKINLPKEELSWDKFLDTITC